MKKLTIEVELNGVITAKELKLPEEKSKYDVDINQFIRNYYIDLGYNVGNYIRIC